MIPLKQFYYKRNRIQQLKGFYHSAQTGSISKAAKKMGLTQAAVTLQIQSLERDIGVDLFKREGQKIKLTELKGFFFFNVRFVLMHFRALKLKIEKHQSNIFFNRFFFIR